MTELAGSSQARASAAADVRLRLARQRRLRPIPQDGFDIFVMRDFLEADRRQAFIGLIEAGRRQASVLGGPVEGFRTNESADLPPGHTVVQDLDGRLAALTGIPTGQGETIQGQRYGPGQEFKPHYDWFNVQHAYWAQEAHLGGQRTWTALIFLNEPASGGETLFPAAGLKVTPRAGNLLLWNNLDAAGEPNRFSLHQGAPVLAGEKYVLTKWFRERPPSPTAPPEVSDAV